MFPVTLLVKSLVPIAILGLGGWLGWEVRSNPMVDNMVSSKNLVDKLTERVSLKCDEDDQDVGNRRFADFLKRD